MSKKVKRPLASTTAQPLKIKKKNSRRSYLFYALALLMLAFGIYYFWKPGSTKKEVNLKGDSGSEPTLFAKNPLLQLLPAAETGIDFANKILEDKTHNVIQNINQYNGGGVAVADINNDQLPDLYFVCSSGKNKLYLNLGNFKFKDITDAAGVGSEDGFETAVTAADVNADGWLDFFVCRAGPDELGRVSKLFINNKDLSFTEQARFFGLDDTSPCSGANFFDYDNDGDLDAYLINHPTDLRKSSSIALKYGPDGKSLVPDLSPNAVHDSDNFYKNEGGKFINISKTAGIQNVGFGLSVSVSDFNYDGWPDVYVGNDFIQPDNLFINNKKGGFTEEIRQYFRHNSMSTMGADLNDFDNDGFMDLLTVDMFPANNLRQKLLKNTNQLSRYLSMINNGFFPPVARNVLQHNNGNGTFSDIACLAGVYKTDWSWSCLMADLDNNGLKDIYIANGYRKEVTNRDYQEFLQPEISKAMSSADKNVLPMIEKLAEYKIRNFVYQNKGNWQFEDKSGDWMTMPGSWSGGGAWADLDADGDLDLIISNLEDPAFIYKNLSREQGGGNYLQVKLQGSPANPFAVGASVLIEYQGIKQYLELNPNHGIFSSVEHLFHFGIGSVGQIEKLTIRWPDGKTQSLSQIPANQRLQLKWTDAAGGYVKHLCPPVTGATLFAEKTAAQLGVGFTHTENPFSDFETWVLNPWTITDYGPLLISADVNGDQLDDFFIGNAFNSISALYLQTPSGGFKPSSAAAFEKDKFFEDQGGQFFDADGDQDMDLFVLRGGADGNSDKAWQCALYLNDGKGQFSAAPTDALPELKDLGLRAAVYDYDGDGDQDIFFGGRLVPKNWPLTPRSVVLQNNGGKFTDVTGQVAGAFERCGMVTDLSWNDLDGDGQRELVVVGEWMQVSVFQLKQNKLEDATGKFGLANSNGLWNKLVVTDLDQDGDLDLVTGNLGLNTRFTASADAPFYCFAKDFDQNGTLDPIVAFTEQKKIYPLMQKEVVEKQLPGLKKQFLYSKDFAKATVSDLWSEADLKSALNLYSYTMETCWWENQGGKFVHRTLPIQAQIAPVQGIICDDFNQDGHPDLLMAGNKYGFEVETNPCDAGNGMLLLGDGKGNFSFMDNWLSGFWAMREARDLALLKGPKGKRFIVVANNNSKPQFFVK